MFVFSNPLRFASGGDFSAETSDRDDITKAVQMALLIRGASGPLLGEVPWDYEMGCAIDYYRHARENLETSEIQGIVMEALKRELPDVRVSSVAVTIAKRVMTISIRHSGSREAQVLVPIS